jgi:uncharacterized phage protein gp47/JayE
MPEYPRPSLVELDARIQADLAAMPGVLREPLSHAWARACHGLHGHLEWIDAQNNPLTCELDRLADWAALYGVARLPAQLARGAANASGSPGSVIFADAILRGPQGLDYRVLATNFMANTGAATVTVRAVEPGDAGNLPPYARLTLVDPLPGVANTLTVDEDGLTGGAPEETADDWRLRVADEWQAMTVRGARGGRPEDYRYWCMTAHPSVTGALVLPQAMGIGSVVIHPICNGAVNRMPAAGVLAAVSETIAAVAPACGDWKLSAPTIRPVDLTLHLETAVDNADTRARISAAALAAVLAEQSETSVLNMSELDAAISTVTNQYTRLAPVENIAVRPGEVLVLAAINYQ